MSTWFLQREMYGFFAEYYSGLDSHFSWLLRFFFQLCKLDKIALWRERFDYAHKIKCSVDGEQLYHQAILYHFMNKCHCFWSINLWYLWFFIMIPRILLQYLYDFLFNKKKCKNIKCMFWGIYMKTVIVFLIII